MSAVLFNAYSHTVPAFRVETPPPKYKCEARSRSRATGQGVRGAKPPEAETLLAFRRSASRKFANFKKNWNAN